MQPSILASFIYIIAFLSLAGGIYAVRKTDSRLYSVTWIPISIIAAMCYQALISAMLNLAHIPVNILSVGIMDIFMSVFLWSKILSNSKIQKYRFEIIDGIMLACLFCVVCAFMVKRYGVELTMSYSSVDGASHLYSAMRVVFSQSLDAMFYSSLHNALLIEVISPLLTTGTYYKAYVLGDILHLLLAGLMFWGTIRKYSADRYMKIAGVLVTIFYLLGYPANSTIFGFSYLGMSLTVILCIIAITNEYIDKNIDVKMMLLLLMTGCFAVFESYMLFVPIIYFGILIWLFVDQNISKKLISVNTIIKGLIIFLVPTGLGLWYAYRGVFGQSDGLTVGKQISLEGGIYRNLFTNFLIIVPFAIAGFWYLIKKRINNVLIYFISLEVVFTFILFVLALDKRVSGYYYYKNYFLLWLILFVTAYIGLGTLEKQGRIIVGSGTLVFVVLTMMYVKKIDVRIQNKNELLYGNATIRPFMDVYATNYDFMCLPRYSEGKLELYGYCRNFVLDEEKADEIELIGGWEDSVWMRAALGVWVDYYDVNSVSDMLDNKKSEYVVVLYDTEDYDKIYNVKENIDVLYENDAGYVAVME